MPDDLPIKLVFSVGTNKVVILDRRIAQRMGITDGNTYVQQELTSEGILLGIKRQV